MPSPLRTAAIIVLALRVAYGAGLIAVAGGSALLTAGLAVAVDR